MVPSSRCGWGHWVGSNDRFDLSQVGEPSPEPAEIASQKVYPRGARGNRSAGVVYFQPVSLLLREHRPGQPCRPCSACFPAGGSLPDSSSCCTAQLSHIGFAVTACEMRPVSCYRICPYLSQNHCRPSLTALVGIPENRFSYVGQLSFRRSTRSAMSGGYFQSGLSLFTNRQASRSRRRLALSQSYSRNIFWYTRHLPSGLLNVAGVTSATKTSSEYLPSLWKQRAFSITRASWFRSGSCLTLKLMSLSHFISQKHIQGWGSRPRNPAEKPCCDEMRRRLTSGLGQV